MTYSYVEQLNTVRRLRVPENSSKRFDCPFCGGRNTLGVTNTNGEIDWQCFKASCPAKGIYNAGLSLEGIQSKLDNESVKIGRLGKPIPDLLTPIRKLEHVEYLDYVHSYEALKTGLIDIKYSPVEDRVMFPVNNGKGYSGRNIHSDRPSYIPKWVKYGDTSSLFTCGTGKIGVLVEDAPSACAVGVIPSYTGLSLLGTYLTDQHKLELMQYERIIVCLDPDASMKGLELASRISGIRPATHVVIPDDLKYYNKDEIESILWS